MGKLVTLGSHRKRSALKSTPLKRRKKFTLTCSYSGAPGMEWHARIQFIAKDKGFECWDTAEHGMWETPGEEELPHRVATSDAPLTWRTAARVLSERGNYESIPECSLAFVTVDGLKGWQADMLALCWCRFGEDQDRDYCPDFLSLSDSDLAALGKEYGSFLPCWGEKGSFLVAYEKIVELCDDETEYDEPHPAGFKEYSLGQLLDHFKIARGAGMLQRLMEALVAEGERREGQIELFERDIEAAIDEATKDIPPPKNRNAAVAIGMRVRPLREYIYCYLEKFGGAPEGKHQVEGKEVYFGRREVAVM